MDQQFGRARERDRAGSTGRAGRSMAGKRLESFFIVQVFHQGVATGRGVLAYETGAV